MTINPSLILGPSFIQTDFTSGSILKKMLMGAFPALPKILMPIVDVRDVALAHLNALKVPEAKN